jgi:hypothetical protein
MTNIQLKTPVAFFIFNRPDTTELVFNEIAKVRPTKLLVVADGPRPSRAEDAENCAAARKIIERIDWDCEILTNYAEDNLGCKVRVSSGLNWVFEQVEEAIILEDDCLPHPSFFAFCEEMLERYRHDDRVSQIGGCNFQQGRLPEPYSYYYSIYHHIWGWASWRRAWRDYDIEMRMWPAFRDENWLQNLLPTKRSLKRWTDVFQAVYEGRIDTWDYQWVYSSWVKGRLAITPTSNLVSNIGFRPDATHTTQKTHEAEIPTERMPFPLRHPPFFMRNTQADLHTQTNIIDTPLLKRVAILPFRAFMFVRRRLLPLH